MPAATPPGAVAEQAPGLTQHDIYDPLSRGVTAHELTTMPGGSGIELPNVGKPASAGGSLLPHPSGASTPAPLSTVTYRFSAFQPYSAHHV